MSSVQDINNADKEERISRFPLLSSYVTIKLDLVKSVKILEDDDATSAAHAATSKVYVGYLVDVCIFIFASIWKELLNDPSTGIGSMTRMESMPTTWSICCDQVSQSHRRTG